MHPDVLTFGALLLGGYFWALRALGPARIAPGQPAATRAQKRSFVLATAALVVGSGWPLHDLAEGYLYSAHMVQHLLFILVVAPLFLMGTPAWLARAIIPRRAMRFARFVTRPLPALAIFNAALVFSHWPFVVDAQVHNEAAHFGVHAMLTMGALVMWTPVLSPILELPRLSYPMQMMYLFLVSLIPTVPASFLTFGSRPLYSVYSSFPRLWGLSALDDQRAAGLIMKLGGGLVLWGVITVLFFSWYRIEKRDGIDLVGLREIDRNLNRMEPHP